MVAVYMSWMQVPLTVSDSNYLLNSVSKGIRSLMGLAEQGQVDASLVDGFKTLINVLHQSQTARAYFTRDLRGCEWLRDQFLLNHTGSEPFSWLLCFLRLRMVFLVTAHIADTLGTFFEYDPLMDAWERVRFLFNILSPD
jgi:hypothetical protein